jgi:hypothetical protein
VIMLVIKIFRVTFRVIIDSKKDFCGVVSGLPNSFFFKHPGLPSRFFHHPGFWSLLYHPGLSNNSPPMLTVVYACPLFTPERVTFFSLFEQMISLQI